MDICREKTGTMNVVSLVVDDSLLKGRSRGSVVVDSSSSFA